MIPKGTTAFIVCVNYSDFLSITLPHNRHHFKDVIVVTSHADRETFEVCKREKVSVVISDAFYDDGALFNKWKPLDIALRMYARDWICLLDADILLPQIVYPFSPQIGKLYVPTRRMVKDPLEFKSHLDNEFKKFPLPKFNEEFAGYCQIFHANDPALGDFPWHELNWRHAGGADSFFWMKWNLSDRYRPNFDVLHFGEDGLNWGGRVTPMLDGREMTGAESRSEELRRLIEQRSGRKGPDRYKAEKF